MDFLLCKICQVPYDEDEHRPRHAPCGHELCTSCIRALIKDSIFECPKCRQTNKADVPDDMPVNFGLIEVIRAFKTKNIPSGASGVSGKTNEEICSIHCKSITHWCLNCQMWICDDCLESHSTLMGCSTTSSSEAMKNLKDKHIGNSDTILAIFKEDANYVNTKLQEHTKLAEKHSEEAKKLRSLLEQGNAHEKKFIESKNHLNTANSPNAVSERIKVLTQRKQLLRSWSVMNLGTDTPLGISKAFAEKKDVYTEMEIEFKKMYAKLTQQEESIYFHTFRKQALADGSICMPFGRIQKMIPPCPSLVFLELSLGGTIMGNVHLRLNKNLPNIRAYMEKIVTGQNGESLREVKFSGKRDYDIYYHSLPFSGIPVTVDKCEAPTAKRGDLLGYFGNNYLQHIYWYVGTKPNSTGTGYSNYHIVGTVEEGMDLLMECHGKHSDSVPLMISDCGLVMEPQ